MFILFCSNITNSDERDSIYTDDMEACKLSYGIKDAVEMAIYFIK